MNPLRPACLKRLWRWWGSDPSPRRRAVSTALLISVFVATTWQVQNSNHRTRDLANATAAVVAQQEADRQERRVTNAANNYALCQQGVNDTRMRVAQMVELAFNLNVQARAPDQQALVDAAVQRLTAGLVLFDCSVYLQDLTPDQVAQVQSTTIPPTIPRRP